MKKRMERNLEKKRNRNLLERSGIVAVMIVNALRTIIVIRKIQMGPLAGLTTARRRPIAQGRIYVSMEFVLNRDLFGFLRVKLTRIV
jgi:hypothetical protein